MLIDEELSQFTADEPMYANWLKIMQADDTPASIALRFGPVRARSVAKSLAFCSSCTSVDLSHAMLTDLSGCFLARSLKLNTALKVCRDRQGGKSSHKGMGNISFV